MVGKFGISASFAVFYVFVGELLPTVLRSQAMGIASFIAGIGLLTFPFIVSLVSTFVSSQTLYTKTTIKKLFVLILETAD